MVAQTGYIIIAAIIFVTVITTFIIGISAKKIDFGLRILRPQARERLVARRPREERRLFTARSKSAPAPPPEPFEESAMIKREKKKEAPVAKARDFLPEESDDYFEKLEAGEKESTPPLVSIIEPADEGTDNGDEEPDYGHLGSDNGDEDTDNGDEEFEEVAEMVTVSEEPENGDEGVSRDLSIQMPKNMCLEEVFRMKITLIKAEEFTDELALKELEMDKKEAEYFALTVTKLGEKVVEATTRINGLTAGSLTVRPIAVGNVAIIAPTQRTIYFDPEQQEIEVEFFITPNRYTTDVLNVLRIEFEQNFKIIKTVNVPMKIYKHKLEAIFGLNISKPIQRGLFVYSAVGTISGLISLFSDTIVPFILNLFGA
ncbi:MAG: hypothetical protein ACXABK_02320 [Candidatus Heimdallarchaeaceae archaeon]|jgi:hypothetical protein